LHHANEWLQPALSTVASNAAPPPATPLSMPSAPVASAKTASGGLYFPSSASIPPVSIMNAEPTGPQQQAAAPGEGTAKTPVVRKPIPSNQQVRRPTNLAAPVPPVPVPGQPSDE